MTVREKWHDRVISELSTRLLCISGLVSIRTSKGSQRGPDIVITISSTGRKINIEVQQFDSGGPWKPKTIPSWSERHDLATLVVFTEPTLERIRNKVPETKAYAFLSRDGVFLFSVSQLPDIVSLVMTLVMTQKVN
jgi:hypothetical protein